MAEKLADSAGRKVVVLNKADLGTRLRKEDIQAILPGCQTLRLSVKTKAGIDALTQTLKQEALSGAFPHEGEVLLTRERHREAIRRTLGFLQEAHQSARNKVSQEFIALDIRGAMDALGEIAGEATADDILDRIFSEFCIGK